MAVPEFAGGSASEGMREDRSNCVRYLVFDDAWIEYCLNSPLVGRILVIRGELRHMCIYCEGYEEDGEDAAEDPSKAIDSHPQPAASSSGGVFPGLLKTLSGVFQKE